MGKDGGVTVSIRGYGDKLHTMAARLAISVAQEKRDPIFIKYTNLRKKMNIFKRMLLSKYGPAGLDRAMKIMDD